MLLQFCLVVLIVASFTELGSPISRELYCSTSCEVFYSRCSHVTHNFSPIQENWKDATISEDFNTEINSHSTETLDDCLYLCTATPDCVFAEFGEHGCLQYSFQTSDVSVHTEKTGYSIYCPLTNAQSGINVSNLCDAITINDSKYIAKAWSLISNVTEIDIRYSRIRGTLPSEWQTMTSLESLNLYDNQIGGTLPSEWQTMTSLRDLNLSRNQIGGILPSEWKTMTSLHRSDLSHNKINGILPSEWQTMTSLQRLYLYSNQIGGTLPSEWQTMTSLQHLELFNNQIGGILPSEWQMMISLTYVGLTINKIGGTLPSEWQTMTSLQRLYLGNNQIGGTLPSEWQTMTSLQYLNLRYNQIDGILPSEWQTMTSLRILYLSHNQINGILPSEWQTMTSLESLNLDKNQIGGILPSEWQTMTSLRILYLNENQIGGILPSEWQTMTSLQRLYLDNNQIGGTLPSEWQTMTSLTYVGLNENQIGGILPSEWQTMTSLKYLFLNKNQIGGTLPSEWQTMTSLHQLDLGGNQIGGFIPVEWKSNLQLHYFNIDHNPICTSSVHGWTCKVGNKWTYTRVDWDLLPVGLTTLVLGIGGLTSLGLGIGGFTFMYIFVTPPFIIVSFLNVMLTLMHFYIFKFNSMVYIPIVIASSFFYLYWMYFTDIHRVLNPAFICCSYIMHIIYDNCKSGTIKLLDCLHWLCLESVFFIYNWINTIIMPILGLEVYRGRQERATLQQKNSTLQQQTITLQQQTVTLQQQSITLKQQMAEMAKKMEKTENKEDWLISPTYEAVCQCNSENVLLQLKNEPDYIVKCHCSTCRETSDDQGPMTWVGYNLSLVRSIVREGVSNTPENSRRFQCPICETTMYMMYDGYNVPYINADRIKGKPFNDDYIVKAKKADIIYLGHIWCATENEDGSSFFKSNPGYVARFVKPDIDRFDRDMNWGKPITSHLF